LEEYTIGGLHDFLMNSVLPRYPLRGGRAADLGAGSGALAVRLRGLNFLRNVARLLKPDGIAIITTPNLDSAPARVKFLLRGKLRFLGDARNDQHISPIFWDLLTRQYLPCARLRLAGHRVYPPNGYKINLPRSAWAFRILARFLSGPALLGDTHVFVLKHDCPELQTPGKRMMRGDCSPL